MLYKAKKSYKGAAPPVRDLESATKPFRHIFMKFGIRVFKKYC